MACGVCRHCDTSVKPDDVVVLDSGWSYHKKCHKCYVCGETDLRGADTFRGVIFCKGCSQRIFQGCDTVRHAQSLKYKRRSTGRRRRRSVDRVLTMAVKTGEADSLSSASVESKRKLNRPAVPLLVSRPSPEREKDDKDLKQNSAERGTTTDVTQNMLKLAKERQLARTTVTTPAKPRKKRKIHKRRHPKHECSDLRIAELGASVEIAHVALRNQSERPVIIKSETNIMKNVRSPTLSIMRHESDETADSNEDWRESLYITDDESDMTVPKRRRIKSILKMPLRSFKRNILDRSSLVSFTSIESMCPLRKVMALFNGDSIEHQRHGLKKLYSTINRKAIPYKLGWLPLDKNKITENERSNDSTKSHTRCKHFQTSRSYRCMREQVMRLAGPTRSELCVIRGKILKAISPSQLKKIINYHELQYTV